MREIAARAHLPKANIHYYFKNKLGLYLAVLSDIIDLWDGTLSNLTADDDVAKSLAQYLRKKIDFPATTRWRRVSLPARSSAAA